MNRSVLAAVIAVALGGGVQGPWGNYPTPRIPGTADGKARMDAPTPRTADGSDVADYVRAHQQVILREFVDLVSIPNLRTDLPNIRRNAEQLRQMLDRRGMHPEVWETATTP